MTRALRHSLRTLVALLATSAVVTRSGAAQSCQTPNGATGTCSINVSSSLTIPTIIRLTVNDTTTLTAPTDAIYTTGSVVNTGPTAIVRSNTTWSLSVAAAAATWTASGTGARAAKPAADLLWGTSAGGPFTALTTTAATVATGSMGSSSSTQMYYKSLWNIVLDGPGTYTLTLIYTVTAP